MFVELPLFLPPKFGLIVQAIIHVAEFNHAGFKTAGIDVDENALKLAANFIDGWCKREAESIVSRFVESLAQPMRLFNASDVVSSVFETKRLRRDVASASVLSGPPFSMLSLNSLTGTAFQINTEKSRLTFSLIVNNPKSDYYSGTFDVDITYPVKYPMEAPLVRFITKVFHPSICPFSGLVDLPNTILYEKTCWSPVIRLEQLIVELHSMLSEPCDISCHSKVFNPTAFEIKATNKQLYSKTVKYYVERYAK